MLFVKKKNIVLVGFRGSKKKEFGLALSRITNLPFADIDSEVEFLIGGSIDSFVNTNGWQVYREIEQKVAHDFCRNFSGIVATGSGTIENSKNLENLKKTGVFVFTNPDFSIVRAELLKNTEESKRERINPDIPFAQEIDQMWSQRKNIYQAISDIEIHYNILNNLEQEAHTILPQLQKSLPKPPKPRKIVFIGSQSSTLLARLIDRKENGRIPNVTFSAYITDSQADSAIKLMSSQQADIHVQEKNNDFTPEESDRFLMNTIRKHNPDFVLVGDSSLSFSSLYREQFGNITLQSHPSLIFPDLLGKNKEEIQEYILEHEERYTGCTLYRLSQSQHSETLLQRKILIQEEDTTESLFRKVELQEILGFCEILERHT